MSVLLSLTLGGEVNWVTAKKKKDESRLLSCMPRQNQKKEMVGMVRRLSCRTLCTRTGWLLFGCAAQITLAGEVGSDTQVLPLLLFDIHFSASDTQVTPLFDMCSEPGESCAVTGCWLLLTSWVRLLHKRARRSRSEVLATSGKKKRRRRRCQG